MTDWLACPIPTPKQPQVKTSQPDLRMQTVWDNVWGIVQVVFLPGGKVMTVHKPGELHVYNSVNSNAEVGGVDGAKGEGGVGVWGRRDGGGRRAVHWCMVGPVCCGLGGVCCRAV